MNKGLIGIVIAFLAVAFSKKKEDSLIDGSIPTSPDGVIDPNSVSPDAIIASTSFQSIQDRGIRNPFIKPQKTFL